MIKENMPGIWGGIECSINRVGNHFKDQLRYSGHYDRPDDIECLAELGIKKIRYPVLWERHQPQKNNNIDWSWTDRQLNILRRSGMEVIAGLVHHGSGPAYTSLLDPDFPFLLADYAHRVASRYHWLKNFTPVNEPLTTARFSGLYGLWYPHACDEKSFYAMLIHQLKAVVLSMKAIRTVNSSACLIQTEDIGKTHSTPLLRYQADFENERRLLTFDLLTGKIDPGHGHGRYMLERGIPEKDLLFFKENPCAPEVLGLNYYITSERWLDERTELYDELQTGGNGLHTYTDTEVVRASPAARSGLKKLAVEIWQRYQIPLAITEAHLHGTREDEMRWLQEIWDQAVELCREGVPVEGVTAWALLGSFDWDSLLTKTGTQYETGAFDVMTSSGPIRPTAVAALIKEIAGLGKGSHPVLEGKGWWHPATENNKAPERPLVILGRGSAVEKDPDKVHLKNCIIRACQERRIDYVVRSSVSSLFILKMKPWAVIELDDETELPYWVGEHRVQYATFCEHRQGSDTLTVLLEPRSAEMHHINKVLDLLIDGYVGVWNFDMVEA